MNTNTGFKRLNSDLFDLVKSMSKEEKRYLKLYAGDTIKQNENQFIKLFDVIDTLDDPKKVSNKKLAAFSDKQLNNTQFYLYHFILNCLRTFESENSVEMRIKKMLLDVDLLSKKTLYGQSLKLLAKAEALAEKYKKNNLLLIIYFEFYNIYVLAGRTDNDSAESSKVHQRKYIRKLLHMAGEVDLVIKHLDILATFFHDDKKLTSNEEKRRHLGALLRSSLYKKDVSAYSLDVRMLNNHLHELTHYTQNQYTERSAYTLKNIELYEENSILIEEDPGAYVILRFQHVNNLVFLKKYEEALSWVEKTQNVFALYYTKRNRDIPFRLKLNVEVYRSLIYIRVADFNKSTECNKTFGELLLDRENNEEEFLVTQTCFYLAYINYGAGNYKKSLKWLNQIINEFDEQVNSTFHFHARMLTLFIHYEQGNDNLLTRLILETEDHVSAHLKDKKFLISFLDLFARLTRENENKAKNIVLKELTKVVNSGNELQKDFFERGFHYLTWIRAQQTGIPFKGIYITDQL